ncbi:hypothetical protein ACWFPY_25265 [Nocardia fluminea]
MFLHTCHRIEWYTEKADAYSPIAELNGASEIFGRINVTARLGQIAAGVKSLIVGDHLVFQQVLESGHRVAENSAIGSVFSTAIALASEARHRFDIAPIVDYSDILGVLRVANNETSGPVKRLIIIGGGMLAQSIAVASGSSYGEVVIVTRNPTRLRRSLIARANGRPQPFVTTARNAAEAYTDLPFDLVIATTSANETYLNNLSAIANSANVGRALDYSATPFLPVATPNYLHISSDGIMQWVSELNRPVQVRAAYAAAWIAEQLAHSNRKWVIS